MDRTSLIALASLSTHIPYISDIDLGIIALWHLRPSLVVRDGLAAIHGQPRMGTRQAKTTLSTTTLRYALYDTISIYFALAL